MNERCSMPQFVRILSTRLSPSFASAGLHLRSRNVPVWQERDDMGIAAWVHKSGWFDKFLGKEFTLEFEQMVNGIPREQYGVSLRLGGLTNDLELESLLAINTQVLSSLNRPTDEWLEPLDPETRQWYLEKFDRYDLLNPRELRLCYFSVEHVEKWCDELIELLPRVIWRIRHVDREACWQGARKPWIGDWPDENGENPGC